MSMEKIMSKLCFYYEIASKLCFYHEITSKLCFFYAIMIFQIKSAWYEFNTLIMNDMNNKRNCGFYGSMTKRLREALESLNIYDDCLWAYGNGRDNFDSM